MHSKLIIFLLLLLATGCKFPEKPRPTVHGYDLSKPEKFFMPESLLEISGITFHEGNSDTIYAIQDEEGKLFRLPWNVKKQYHGKFGKKGDYEDLAIINNKAYILKSNGSIYSFPFADAVYEEIDSATEWKQLLPEGEYESMYGDETTGRLYILCKNCPADHGEKQVSGYIVQSGDSAYLAGSFQVSMKGVTSDAGKVKSGFRPSALSRNPLTGDWYILSSVNKLLVVTDGNWNIKETCPLSTNSFNQPEGLTFDKAGNLYISNEGDDLAQGNILKFNRKAN